MNVQVKMITKGKSRVLTRSIASSFRKAGMLTRRLLRCFVTIICRTHPRIKSFVYSNKNSEILERKQRWGWMLNVLPPWLNRRRLAVVKGQVQRCGQWLTRANPLPFSTLLSYLPALAPISLFLQIQKLVHYIIRIFGKIYDRHLTWNTQKVQYENTNLCTFLLKKLPQIWRNIKNKKIQRLYHL